MRYSNEYIQLQRKILVHLIKDAENAVGVLKALQPNLNMFIEPYRKAVKTIVDSKDESLNTVFRAIELTNEFDLIFSQTDLNLHTAHLEYDYKDLAKEANRNARISMEELAEALQKKYEPKPFTVFTIEQIMEDATELESLVSMPNGEPLLPAVGVCSLTGDAGSYKTFTCLHLAGAIANGEKWLDYFQTKQGNVLYIDEENGISRLKKRLNLIFTPNVEPPKNIFFAPFTGVNFVEPSWQKKVTDFIRNNGISFVVVDSFVDVLRGDENSVEAVQPVMHAIRTIANDAGCCFMLIHHNNKGGTYRGSSAFKGALDALLDLKRAVKDAGNNKTPPTYFDNLMEFDTVKARDTATFDKPMKLNVSFDAGFFHLNIQAESKPTFKMG